MAKRVSGEGWVATRARKDGLWVAQYTVVEDGTTRRPVVYGRTRAEAAKKLRDALAARDTGRRPRAPAYQTVADFLDTWHEGTRPVLRTRSYARQEEHVRLHLKPTIGARSLVRLQPEDVQRAYAKLLAGGDLGPATVRRVHAVLHRALDQAVRWRLVASNVADLVDAPRVPRPEMHALSVTEVRKLLRAATGDRLVDGGWVAGAADPFRALWVLAVTTGMRRGELFALRWRDVDLGAARLRVTGSLTLVKPDGAEPFLSIEEPKTAQSRRPVELTAVAVDALATHRAQQLERRLALANVWKDRDLVFPGATGAYFSITSSLLYDAYHELLDRAGLPRMRFHDLRHTAATVMMERKVHPKVVSEMLGHSVVSTTLDMYSHVTPSMQRAAADELDAAFA